MSVWREVQEALYQRWRDRWVTDGPEPVELTPYAFENEDFDPPDGPWVRVYVKRLPGGPGTMGRPGNRKMDRRGQLLILLREPSGDGTGEISDLADKAAKIFENCRILSAHDIRFAEVEPGEGAAIDKGTWWGLPVEGTFDYEEHN